jgi:prepilin-type N-terminal cleavage/methylation domain-containing protein
MKIQRARRAFTLIELLVVIAIIVALAGITLLFYPKREVRLAADGADRLQTYIAAARSRALRDQAPRGVRLEMENGAFRQIQLVEVPDPFAPNTQLTVRQTAPNVAEFPNGFGSGAAPVAGDLLEILHGAGSTHRVLAVSGNRLTLSSNVPAAAVADLSLTGNYRFVRQAQPLMGEPTLQLPNTVLVRPNGTGSTRNSSRNIPTSFDGSNSEIIFAPSGQVINATSGRIILWVADENNVSIPTLLTIYSRTGGVAAHPAATGSDPFAFTKDGRSSGQ